MNLFASNASQWYPTQPVKQTALSASIPAPVGGLNRRDSLANMPITDAVVMRNWLCEPSTVALRRGWREHATKLGGPVGTLLNYTATTGIQSLFAAAGGKLYDVTNPIIAPIPMIATTFGYDWWQHTQLTNEGGSFLYMVNGVDQPIVWDGTNWTQVLEEDPPLGFNIKGINPNKFVNVTLHQRRLWFVEKDSMNAWYLDVDSIGGTATKFPVGQLFANGGFLQSIISWTLDAGAGMDDYLVFISSEGDVAVYVGTDPDLATDWGLQGVYHIGASIGRRCAMKYAGDVALICQDGLMPLSKGLMSTRVNTSVALTDKIQRIISGLVSDYADTPGWETLLFPKENQMWLNVPIPTNKGGARQYCMSTLTGSWSEFVGMDALCFELFKEDPYFGTTDGRVCAAWDATYLDDQRLDPEDPDKAGRAIETEVIQAFSYFDKPGQLKRWTMARPIFQSGGIVGDSISLNIDYDISTPPPAPEDPTQTATYLWDVALWDQAKWSRDFSRYKNWQTVTGIGYSAALHMRVYQNTETRWIATDFVYELGAIL